MKDQKGHIILGIAYLQMNTAVATVLAFKAAFMAMALAAIWHIPAWGQAKANHTEAAYQSQEMFPQQLFDKLPGGTPGRTINAVPMGNGGNFAGGIS